MLARQRQARITAELRRTGGVRISDLAGPLGVSDMTIRRDLECLVAAGLATKVYGGAVLAVDDAESAIAAEAASLVRPGTAVGLAAGGTTWAMTAFLGDVEGLTLVTNSTAVATALAALPEPDRRTVVLTGGVRTAGGALVGPMAEVGIRAVHLDQVFVAADGMTPPSGFTATSGAEAHVSRAMIERSSEVIVLADSTRWGVACPGTIGPLGVAGVVVSDDGLPATALTHLQRSVGVVRLVRSAAG